MIDWGMKVIELKSMVDEMDMWTGKTDGGLKAMLGRNVDEMRAFIRNIEAELVPSERSVLDEPPAWVTDPDMSSLDMGYDPYEETGQEGGFGQE